jgi:hypothetical protein
MTRAVAAGAAVRAGGRARERVWGRVERTGAVAAPVAWGAVLLTEEAGNSVRNWMVADRRIGEVYASMWTMMCITSG